MNSTEIFQILGIEFTADEQVIRNAYREKLAVTNPEDDQEGFMRLRAAYEEACRMAKMLRQLWEKASSGKGNSLEELVQALGQDVQSGQSVRSKQAMPSKDLTPSGLWLEKAEKIYANIGLRKDVGSWKELFDDDCFLSLEEEENCRLKLLSFLTEHFRLPTAVWKLLNEKLSIAKDIAFLKEHYPIDFIRYIINKCERGEDVDFDQFEGADDASYDLYLLYYDRCLQAFQEGNLELAKEHIQNADQLDIRHPIMEICRAELLVRQGSPGEAIELLEALRARYPSDPMISYNTAEVLWKQGEKDASLRDRAAAIYQELKTENDAHYMANMRLTEWYFDRGSYREAKNCAEKVLSVGGDPSFMELLVRVNSYIEKDLESQYRENGGWEPALELCWCYLQDGRISKGIMLALKLEKMIAPEKTAEYNGLMAKLYVEAAEYETSITMTKFWEQELEKKLSVGENEEEAEKDRDRLRQAHLIRMQCYLHLGLSDSRWFSEAIREGESVLTGTVKDAGVLLEMIRIYLEMSEYELCQKLVDKLIDEYQVFAAYATSMECFKRQRDAGGVLNAAGRCLHFFPGYVKAYEYLAEVYMALRRTEDFRKLMESAEKNGVKSVLLEAYGNQMDRPSLAELSPVELKRRVVNFRNDYLVPLEKGQQSFYESGLPVINALLYRCPDSYMLVQRGMFHKAGHHYIEAREDYEKAISLKPSNSYALGGLSQVYKYMGDYEKALVCVRKAILYNDESTLSIALYTDMATLHSLLGNYEMALAACRQYEEQIEKPNIIFLNQKAECYVNLGQTEQAVKIYQSYFDQAKFISYQMQVDACVRGLQKEPAREILDRWKAELDALRRHLFMAGAERKRLNSYFSKYHNAAGWAELVFGEPDEALKHFEKSVAGWKPGSAEFDTRCGDAAFAAAVCGSKKLGARLGKQLKISLNRASWSADNPYLEKEKMRLYYQLLGEYFTESEEKLRELLENESSCRICWFCTSPVCKELEGVRILFLIKTGQEQEARERLKKNLEIQPANEYMLAIRHVNFADKA